MELQANCKINLGLRVLRRREDGFHDIETVMMPVHGLFDTVSVSALPSESNFFATTPLPYPSPVPVFPNDSVLEVSGIGVDCPPQQNICMRALHLIQREFGIGEAIIELHKRIPAGAGLGGGSSDAAATLVALNKEFVLELSDAELRKLAVELGSDVPFFVVGAPALCTGRGEIMAPVEVALEGYWLAIVKPPVEISTTEAYRGVVPRLDASGYGSIHEGGKARGSDDFRYGGDPRHSDGAGLSLPEIVARPVREWRELSGNDFEASVFARYPQISTLKESLYTSGALYASMSGSGSAVFGIFDHKPNLPGLHSDSSLFVHVEQFG